MTGSTSSTVTSAEEIIARFACQQHGIVTRKQLLRAGISRRQLEWRVKAKRLRPLYRGVYVAGPLIAPLARDMAAVLACGEGAVLSHVSAARLWALLPRQVSNRPVDVTIPGRDRGRRPGIRAHRVARLDAQDVAAVDGIALTAPPRTIIDIGSVVGARALEQAVARAERERLLRMSELKALLDRQPGRPGARAVRALLDGHARPALTRSEAEERLLELIRKHHLPAPEVNVLVGGHEVDFLWRSERILVEVDGFAFHSSRASFESDRRRDGELAALGFHVIRVTWRQVVEEPGPTMVRIAQALALAGARR